MDKKIYWHRDLPPLSEQIEGEHFIDAESDHVAARFADRDAAWWECHASLMRRLETRLLQEIERLGGTCAHVLTETITTKTDDKTGHYFLKGVIAYILYRHEPTV